MKMSAEKQPRRWEETAEPLHGPRAIGELMPAVLARHGIDPDALLERRNTSAPMLIQLTNVMPTGTAELARA